MERWLGVVEARPKPWLAGELWVVIEQSLPRVSCRSRHPGRKRHPDRLVSQGILLVLHTLGCTMISDALGRAT